MTRTLRDLGKPSRHVSFQYGRLIWFLIDSGEERIFIFSKVRKSDTLKIVKYSRGPFSKNTWTSYEAFDYGIDQKY